MFKLPSVLSVKERQIDRQYHYSTQEGGKDMAFGTVWHLKSLLKHCRIQTRTQGATMESKGASPHSGIFFKERKNLPLW